MFGVDNKCFEENPFRERHTGCVVAVESGCLGKVADQGLLDEWVKLGSLEKEAFQVRMASAKALRVEWQRRGIGCG